MRILGPGASRVHPVVIYYGMVRLYHTVSTLLGVTDKSSKGPHTHLDLPKHAARPSSLSLVRLDIHHYTLQAIFCFRCAIYPSSYMYIP